MHFIIKTFIKPFITKDIHKLVRNGDTRLLKIFLDVYKNENDILYAKNELKRNALNAAILSNKFDVADTLIDKNFNILKPNNGSYPLFNALMAYNKDNKEACTTTVKKLIKKGADYKQSVDGYSVFQQAICSKAPEIIVMMLKKDPNIIDNTDEKYSSLAIAIKTGDLEILEQITKAKPEELHRKIKDIDLTPIEYAAEQKNENVLKFMMEKIKKNPPQTKQSASDLEPTWKAGETGKMAYTRTTSSGTVTKTYDFDRKQRMSSIEFLKAGKKVKKFNRLAFKKMCAKTLQKNFIKAANLGVEMKDPIAILTIGKTA